MNHKFKILESEGIFILNILSESKDFSSFSDFDVYDAFISFFKNWVRGKYGEKVVTYPLSYLLRKYSRQFVEDNELGLLAGEIDDDDFEIDRWTAERIVRELWLKNKISFPTLEKNEKFTEKYKKHLDLFFSEAKIPEWFKFSVFEKTPNYVDIRTFVDYPEMLKSEETFNTENFERDLKKYFKNYLGVEFGNPMHGEVRLEISDPELGNLDSWVKNVLNKTIKKEIKQMPFGQYIHSIKFEPRLRNAYIQIVFKSSAGYSGRHQLVENIKSYLSSLGYNLHKIRIER
jgi:hypothetical protein